MNFLRVLLLVLPLLTCLSCNKNFKGKEFYYQYEEVEVNNSTLSDQELENLITPYRKELESKMSKVIGYGIVPLNKMQPEGTLGNFMTDLLLEEAEEELEAEIDLCVMNYGGIRVPVIDSGEITLGDVYELMPFDNTLVLCQVTGEQLMELMRHMMGMGGWPVSNGVQITKESDQLVVLINGKLVKPGTRYTLLANDYMANGGDGCSFMADWDKEYFDWLMRDKIIEHIEELQADNGKVYAELNGRIIIFE